MTSPLQPYAGSISPTKVRIVRDAAIQQARNMYDDYSSDLPEGYRDEVLLFLEDVLNVLADELEEALGKQS